MSTIWKRVNILTDDNEEVNAIAPLIITASRSTDIPAFYSQWFLDRLKKGYVRWINPYNKKPVFISFESMRLIVFWTKNARPIFNYLSEIDDLGYNYYFQYTLNDYESEGLERDIPPLKKRIETFKTLSENIGKSKVIWRFDPLIITDRLTPDILLKKIKHVGDQLYQYTEKLVISFADIERYKKVKSNLRRAGVNYSEFNKNTMREIARGIEKLNRKWKLDTVTCAEQIDLKEFGIKHNKCVDNELIKKIFHKDKKLMSFVGLEDKHMNRNKKSNPLKDKGQRKHCGCIYSKDIGQYDTCGHLCWYCYANSSPEKARQNMRKHTINSDSILTLRS